MWHCYRLKPCVFTISWNSFAVKKFLAIVDSNIIEEIVLGKLITIITLPCKAQNIQCQNRTVES